MTSTNEPSKGTVTGEQLKGDLPDRVAEANEKGYWGEVTDPTPNSAYTLSGVTAGEATPETDAELAADAEANQGAGDGDGDGDGENTGD